MFGGRLPSLTSSFLEADLLEALGFEGTAVVAEDTLVLEVLGAAADLAGAPLDGKW